MLLLFLLGQEVYKGCMASMGTTTSLICQVLLQEILQYSVDLQEAFSKWQDMHLVGDMQ